MRSISLHRNDIFSWNFFLKESSWWALLNHLKIENFEKWWIFYPGWYPIKPEILQNHSNEGKGKDKRKERGEGKEAEKQKKAMVALLVFIIATLKIVFGRNNCCTQKVYLAIMSSNIRLHDPTKWTALMPSGLKPNSSIFAQIFDLKRVFKIQQNMSWMKEPLSSAGDILRCFYLLFFHFRLRSVSVSVSGFWITLAQTISRSTASKYDMKLRYFRKRFTMVRSSF